MAARFLITGTDTGVGKTTVACALARSLRAHGITVGVMKPVETGCPMREGQLEPADALALLDAAASNHPLETVCPYRYRLPLAPATAAEAEGIPPPDLGRIAAAFYTIAAQSEVTLVVGAGGLAVPITWNENYAHLALALELEVILVVANRLGCLNATLLTLEYAARSGLNIRGYILNDVEADPTPAGRTNADSLRRLTKVACLAMVGIGQTQELDLAPSLLGSDGARIR